MCPFLPQLATFVSVLCCSTVFSADYSLGRKEKPQLCSGFQKSLAELTSVVQEGYLGQRMVKIYDAYQYEQKRFVTANGLMRKLSLRMQRVSGAGTPMTHFVSMCAVSIVVALLQAQHGTVTLGEYITFLSAFLLLLTPIRHLSSLNGAMVRVRVAAESIFEMLDELEEKDPGELELKRIHGDVSFEGHISI